MDTKFKPGQSGNPKGRLKGSRNKLSEAFLLALHDDFAEHGIEAIAKVRHERPQDYLRVIASILPKQMSVQVEDDLSDEELDERVRVIAKALGLEILGLEETVH